MILSSSFGTLMKHFGYEKAIDEMVAAGFDAMDFGFENPKYCSADSIALKNELLQMRAYAEARGVRFNQAHAPAPSSASDPTRTKQYWENIVNSMRTASYLGVPIIIVHPMQHLNYFDEGAPEKLFEMNMIFYNSLKPYCEEYNIKVGVENMWQSRGKKILHSTCSRPEEFNRYLDELNSEWFVGCLDFGHAFLVCEDLDVFVEKMGGKRLKALHVHDVDGITDGHTLPFYGNIEWNRVMKALAKIGYDGDLTYEADGFFARNPVELFPSVLRHMADTGKYLIKKFDEYKKEAQ